jgi:maleate cis-trans isomerase
MAGWLDSGHPRWSDDLKRRLATPAHVAINFWEENMPFGSWRGTAGLVRPTYRPGGMEELIKMLPDGVGIIPLFAEIERGTQDEFKVALERYGRKVAKLAEIGVDVINPSGAPPFMVLGYEGEAALIREWRKNYGKPVFTSGTTHVDALRVLGVQRFVGFSYFPGEINKIYGRYFEDAGFNVLDMVGFDAPFQKIQDYSSRVIYAWIREEMSKHPIAQAIYMLGPGWRTLDIIDALEQDCGVPVVHAVPSQCWDIQRHLGLKQKVPGFGRLLAEML